MRTSYLRLWLSVLLVFHVTATRADENARRLLRKAEANLVKASSMQAEMISPDHPEKGVMTVRVLRPGYFAMIGGGPKGSRAVLISDSKHRLIYDEKARSGNYVEEETLYTMGNGVPDLFFITNFLEPRLLQELEQPTYAGEVMRNGRTYRVIKCPATEERGAWTLYIGPKDMLEGIESEAIDSRHPGLTVVMQAERIWLRNIHLNAPLKPGQFTYVPPKGAKITASDDPVRELPPLNSVAPPFTMPGVNGETFTLESLLKGKKALLLNITFGECVTCIQELPALKRLYADLKDKGLAMLAVNIVDDQQTAREIIKKYDIPYPMGLDNKAGGGQYHIEKRYHVRDAGMNILIGSNGRILWYQSNLNEQRLRCVLERAGIPAIEPY